MMPVHKLWTPVEDGDCEGQSTKGCQAPLDDFKRRSERFPA